MAKNIIVFSDGTGQDGAVRLDVRLSNVYKLYRASRIGADTSIDPAEQIAFYDPGLGTDADCHGWNKISRAIYKTWASIAGRGIGTNIADCYEFIINHWRPDDRIFIFGFSRGAYTARCVAQVLSLCGVPTHGYNDEAAPFQRFGRPARLVAERAVHQVYEHGAGYPRATYEAERNELARRFRVEFGSDEAGAANAYPYFIGVFDTVAALGARGLKRYLLIGALVLLGALAVTATAFIAVWLPSWLFWRILVIGAAIALSLALGMFGVAIASGLVLAVASLVSGLLGWGTALPPLSYWGTVAAIAAVSGLASVVKLRHDSYRYIDNFPPGSRRKSHHIRWKAENYDRGLSAHVGYARHATAIDETRSDFARLGWGKTVNERPKVGDEPDPFVQLYFCGNHSDIGGSYPEPESRLSDFPLKWMVDEATALPNPLLLERDRLQPFPDPAGTQHSEPEAVRENMLWWVPSWAPAWLRQGWSETLRTAVGFPIHPSVFQRFAAKNADAFGACRPYRPPNLADDRRFAWAYDKCDPLHDDLLAAQQEAFYSANGIAFIVGKASKALADLLNGNEAGSAAGIFPGNPKPDANSCYLDALALSMLQSEIAKAKLAAVPLQRNAAAGAIAEQGLLVFDISDTDASTLALSFGAITMIKMDAEGTASLIDITPSLSNEPVGVDGTS